MSICSQLPQLAISVSELLCAWCCITGIVFCWCYGRILFIVGCKVRDLIGTDCSATNLLCPWCYAASNYAACWMLCHTYAMHSRCRIGSSDGESLAQLFASGKLRGNWRKWQKRTLTVICLPWRCQQWLLHPISNPPRFYSHQRPTLFWTWGDSHSAWFPSTRSGLNWNLISAKPICVCVLQRLLG